MIIFHNYSRRQLWMFQLCRDILRLHFSSELFRNCLSTAWCYHGQPPKAGSAQQAVLSSWVFEGQAMSWSLQKQTGAASHCSSHLCLVQAGADRGGMPLVPTAPGQTVCFSSYGVSSRLDSEEEPIMLYKNSPHNSKAYWSPEFSIIEDKRFESFCSKLQESKQKDEDKR